MIKFTLLTPIIAYIYNHGVRLRSRHFHDACAKSICLQFISKPGFFQYKY